MEVDTISTKMQGFVIASPSDFPFRSTTVFRMGPQTTLASGRSPARVVGTWTATEPSRTVHSAKRGPELREHGAAEAAVLRRGPCHRVHVPVDPPTPDAGRVTRLRDEEIFE